MLQRPALQAIFDDIFQQVVIHTSPSYVEMVEVTQPYINVDQTSFSVTPDSVVDDAGKTVITWENVAQYVGNNDEYLAASETFVVTFEAASSSCGPRLPVDVEPDAMVRYLDPTGNVQSVPIPQAWISVNCPSGIPMFSDLFALLSMGVLAGVLVIRRRRDVN